MTKKALVLTGVNKKLKSIIPIITNKQEEDLIVVHSIGCVISQPYGCIEALIAHHHQNSIRTPAFYKRLFSQQLLRKEPYKNTLKKAPSKINWQQLDQSCPKYHSTNSTRCPSISKQYSRPPYAQPPSIPIIRFPPK